MIGLLKELEGTKERLQKEMYGLAMALRSVEAAIAALATVTDGEEEAEEEVSSSQLCHYYGKGE
jgi:hypothetical protein